MFNTPIKDDKSDSPQEEESNRIEFWINNQTIFETFSNIETNQGDHANNVNPSPNDLNATQNYLNVTSTHNNLFEIEFPNENFTSLTNKEDRILIIKKAPFANQNKSFRGKKRLRFSWNNKSDINANDKENQENKAILIPYNSHLENDGTSGHSSNRCKRRKNNLNDPSNSNIDQNRFRYKIKKIKNIRIYSQNSEFSNLIKGTKSRKSKRAHE